MGQVASCELFCPQTELTLEGLDAVVHQSNHLLWTLQLQV